MIIDDAAGHSAQSWIELPSTFPHLSTTGTLQQDPAAPDAHVFLTLGNFLTSTPYEAVVDGHAVPSWFEQGSGSDLKPVDLGATRYAIARPVTGGGYRIDELDSTFQTLRSHRLENVPASTDFHDSELLPGGKTLMLGYDGNAGFFDAVIQIVDADGHAEFSWNSRTDGDVDPSESYVTRSAADYAHINSLQYLPNGDILASFRNLSQVMRIATTAHDGFTPGQVIWRLGGKRNDFTFDDPGFGGNCAQHMARMLPNGHLMVFDNGSREDPLTSPIGGQSATMCPDPANPANDAARVDRPQTRVVEYALDQATHTATRVWQYVPPTRYAAFAGSQQRLADGTTFVGWSQSNDTSGNGAVEPVASQVNVAGDAEVWRLFGSNWFTYRAAIGPAPDAVQPKTTITTPADGATYVEGQQVVADFGCTDTGGSNLHECQGTAVDTAFVSTTPGSHAFTVTATDGAGNQSVRTVHYDVAARSRPDARVRSASGGLVGDDRYGASTHQRVTARLSSHGTLRTQVTVQNDGVQPDRITLKGAAASARFGVIYRHGGVDMTRQVVRGALRTPMLAPGTSYALTVVTHRLRAAHPGDQRAFVVQATSLLGARRHDAVAVVTRATR